MAGLDVFTHSWKAQIGLAQYSAVQIGTEDYSVTQATAATHDVIGINQRDVNSGQMASVTHSGITRYRAAAAVAVGDRLVAAGSGFLTAVTSGAAGARFIVGRAIDAVASGQVGQVLLQPAFEGNSGAAA